jgi:hypothetical protein
MPWRQGQRRCEFHEQRARVTGKTGLAAAGQRHQPLLQPERYQPLRQPKRSPAATQLEFRTVGVGGWAENVACIFHPEGIGAKRCIGRMDGNESNKSDAAGNNHSIPAWEFYVEGTVRTLSKSYCWNPGLVSFPSADPEGRFPANKKIH